MFVEISKETFEKIREKLLKMGIKFEASDCTLPGDKKVMVHLEVGQLPSELAEAVNNVVERAESDVASDATRDLDNDGIPDKDEPEGGVRVKEVRHRPWEDRGHTPKEEAIGYLTGESTREEVTYEREQ